MLSNCESWHLIGWLKSHEKVTSYWLLSDPRLYLVVDFAMGGVGVVVGFAMVVVVGLVALVVVFRRVVVGFIICGFFLSVDVYVH